jgi:hypothetical protein
MRTKPTNPHHQPETEFNGELQEFSGQAVSPYDPNLGPRARTGRPAEVHRPSTKKKNTQKKD